MEAGQPHWSGPPLQDAQAQVREFIKVAEEWLSAIEDQQESARKERLTPQEEKHVKRLLNQKKARAVRKEKGVSYEDAWERAARYVRSLRGIDWNF